MSDFSAKYDDTIDENGCKSIKFSIKRIKLSTGLKSSYCHRKRCKKKKKESMMVVQCKLKIHPHFGWLRHHPTSLLKTNSYRLDGIFSPLDSWFQFVENKISRSTVNHFWVNQSWCLIVAYKFQGTVKWQKRKWFHKSLRAHCLTSLDLVMVDQEMTPERQSTNCADITCRPSNFHWFTENTSPKLFIRVKNEARNKKTIRNHNSLLFCILTNRFYTVRKRITCSNKQQ